MLGSMGMGGCIMWVYYVGVGVWGVCMGGMDVGVSAYRGWILMYNV